MQPTPDSNGLANGGDVIPLRSARDNDPPSDPPLALVRRIVTESTSGATQAEAAQRALDAITGTLGLSSGTIVLQRMSDEGVPQLVQTASSGPQAQLVRDMPPIDIDSSYEVAVVFAEAAPHYVADMHGEGAEGGLGRTEDSETVGRWRSLISTKSYAVLPLCVGRTPMGVMTLQWPDSREFDAETTELLETVAYVLAIALDRLRESEADDSDAGGSDAGSEVAESETQVTTAGTLAAVPSSEAAAPAAPVEKADAGLTEIDAERHVRVGPLRMEITADGVLMPLAPDAAFGGDARLSLEITLADSACVVWDVSTPHPSVVSVLIASFSSAGQATELRDRLVETARVCSRQDMPLAQTLSLLNGVMVATAGAGAGVAVWLASVDATTGALAHCGSSEADVVVRSEAAGAGHPHSTPRRWEARAKPPAPRTCAFCCRATA